MAMNFKKLADQAKKVVDKRGGTEALKGDLNELKDIAKGKGSAKDKAKEAAAALKTPGAHEDKNAATSTAPPAAAPPADPPASA